jgi:hypothetical protein
MLVGPDAEFYNAVLHWSEAVTSLRRTIRDATWEVSVAGEKIPWNAQARAFTPPVPDEARARRAHRSRWEGALVGAPDERVRAYAPGATFAVGDLVTHGTFGRGVVERHVGPTKIEILFREGPRLLTHAVPGAPTSPTMPRELDLENSPSGDDPF